jgi:hypothetical protein
MYSAIADQLHLLGLSRDPSYHATRHAAAHYLVDNADAFMPFVASIHGEDMAGATDDGMMTPEGYREYCKRVEQSGDWGGEIEIQALAKYYNIPIHVIQHGPPHIISHTPVDEGSGPLTAEQAKMAGDKVVRISYHRRMYGLGEVSFIVMGPVRHAQFLLFLSTALQLAQAEKGNRGIGITKSRRAKTRHVLRLIYDLTNCLESMHMPRDIFQPSRINSRCPSEHPA